ncbi:SpaA isopeptide-forming pilin-related protein [Listeria welshimeri]|uniref:Cell wall-associated surface protein n=1 Tax=Listeria welshimeri serovar 6b (strain ATCC 35897 / DSM 20650 / CCUG 15529 / CIP 8149 / NCTC 11857 / SLCC 5334 / V8) TaxID=386043 RepID=A0AGQ3_LISW6|nr:SpaA isopeptide-forming pilin-related protein [Listeria welshimeri]CAK20185.1 cell wall-associated surface protein [Listeria welshimeri serovar 6b str. SLCC5334]SNV21089.1 Predicted outer membrane protein [Listeria welshimeri]
MNKKKRQAISLVGVLTVMIAFFITPITALAASVNYEKIGDYVSTWNIASLGGLHWTDNGVHMIKADNQPAFCIEHGVLLNGGSGFEPSELNSAEKERLSLISYYGYQISPTMENYGITQNIIWEEFGDTLLTTQLPNYTNRKNEILAKVANYKIKPSFANQNITLNLGDSITLTDTNNVLSKYGNLLENSANLQIEKNGNILKLTATASSKESGKLQYSMVPKDQVGQSFIYKKPGEQTVATFKLSNAGEMNLAIKVNLNGNVKLKKVDEDTGQAVPNTKMKFEYNGQIKEIVTDTNGLAQIDGVKAGTKVKITEVTASNGFVNKGESKEITIEPNKTIEVVFGNKAQQGLLKLKKTGQKAIAVTTTDSDYGQLHDITFDYVPLADVTFNIKAREDIKVGDYVHAKKGSVVATVKTDAKGELINMPKLYLGKYEAIETKAPAGYLMNTTSLPFEFTYEGQNVELVSQSLEAKNDFQQLKITVHKNEEQIQEWKENEPVLEEVKANDKVFGLFTNQEYAMTDNTTVPADGLLAFGTVKDGELVFPNLQLMEGRYYIQELDAGESHNIDTTHHEFEFTATDHETEKVIELYAPKENQEDESLPLLNKLHFNHFSLKKVNEEATLEEKNGYDFTFTGNGKDAIFTLETEDKEVIQTVTVDKDSLAMFTNVPVGTFYLKEKQPSSESYVRSSETYKIVSTLKGVQAYDSKGQLLGEAMNEETSEEEEETEQTEESDSKEPIKDEPIVLLEIKNHLVKGVAELTKTDVLNGKALPNTGIRILDKDKKVVIEGKTDNQGQFTFEKLPKGTYYFQEFEAPIGYQLDETPIQFEIKEDGKVVKSTMTNQLIPNEKGNLPQTGEKTSILGIALGSLLLVGIAIYYFYAKKKQGNKTK